jgi:hypothetical protein
VIGMTLKVLPGKADSPAKVAETEPRWKKAARWILMRAGREARSLLPAWLFFLLSFSLLRWTQTAILSESGVTVLPPSKVLIGSLIVAKALLTVDSLRILARLNSLPILVSALFRTVIYGSLVFFFEYSEVLFTLRARGFEEASHEFSLRLNSPRFWVIQVWIVVLLFAFTLARTFARRLGRRRFRRLLLGK